MAGAKKRYHASCHVFVVKKRQALHMGQILMTPQICIAFLAEEITSLVRGPDFDPYESRERWDPLLSTVDGGRCDDSGEMSLQKTKPQLKVNRW